VGEVSALLRVLTSHLRRRIVSCPIKRPIRSALSSTKVDIKQGLIAEALLPRRKHNRNVRNLLLLRYHLGQVRADLLLFLREDDELLALEAADREGLGEVAVTILRHPRRDCADAAVALGAVPLVYGVDFFELGRL